MNRIALPALYVAFAIVAILVNIGTQALVVAACAGAWVIPLSVAAGTGTGLVTKYWLDKRYIFKHASRDSFHEARTFAAYTMMGLLTTLLFWGSEAAFHLLFRSDAMRYAGGALGLAAGYMLKYRLDRRFVFL